jgi:Holliday junction DNA helicase RuvB
MPLFSGRNRQCKRSPTYLVLEEGLSFPEVTRRMRLAYADAGLRNRARDHASIAGEETIDAGIAAATLGRLGIDRLGLGPGDRAYLGVLRERGPGRPIGLARIAAILGRPPRVLERLHEPYIFRLGLATTTPCGRVALNGASITHGG